MGPQREAVHAPTATFILAIIRLAFGGLVNNFVSDLV